MAYRPNLPQLDIRITEPNNAYRPRDVRRDLFGNNIEDNPWYDRSVLRGRPAHPNERQRMTAAERDRLEELRDRMTNADTFVPNNLNGIYDNINEVPEGVLNPGDMFVVNNGGAGDDTQMYVHTHTLNDNANWEIANTNNDVTFAGNVIVNDTMTIKGNLIIEGSLIAEEDAHLDIQCRIDNSFRDEDDDPSLADMPDDYYDLVEENKEVLGLLKEAKELYEGMFNARTQAEFNPWDDRMSRLMKKLQEEYGI